MLTFSKTTGEQTTKGPYPSVRFQGEQVHAGNGAAVIAAHLPHGWTVDGEDYLRLDVSEPVRVTWEGYAGGASTTGHFSCVNGVAYIDRRILGFVDRQSKDWYLVREGQHQAGFTLDPVTG